MQDSPDLARRRFMRAGAGLSGAALLKLGAPALAVMSQAACRAREQAQVLTILTAHEADDLSAIAARIFPTTDTPSANEAGVVYFFEVHGGSFDGH